MKIPVACCCLLLGLTLSTEARSRHKGTGLPPKFGGLLQPGPDLPTGAATGPISSEISGGDLEFLQATAELGRWQAWLVQAAKEKAESGEMRAIGAALSDLQVKENDILRRLAARKGITLPEASELTAAQKKQVKALTALSGAKLEKELIEEIVRASEQSVAEYQLAVVSEDAEIKHLAEQMLPAAKSRLQFANKAAGRSVNTTTTPTFRTKSSHPAPPAVAPEGSSTATPPPARKATPLPGTPDPASATPAPATVPAKPAPATPKPNATTPAPAATPAAKPVGVPATPTAGAPATPVPAAPSKAKATATDPTEVSTATVTTFPPPKPPRPTPIPLSRPAGTPAP